MSERERGMEWSEVEVEWSGVEWSGVEWSGAGWGGAGWRLTHSLTHSLTD